MLELEPDAEWCQEGPTLSNDIWKKFELIPTPPCSPLRFTELDLEDLCTLPGLSMSSSIELPQLLEDDDIRLNFEPIDLDAQLPDDFSGCEPGGWTCTHGLERGTCTSCTQLALAGSELRHDCMWVGTCTAEAHSHHYHPRIHKDSGSQITDLLMDSSSTVEEASGLGLMADIHPADDAVASHIVGVEDSGLHLPSHHVARPDTPSESSETDTDEDNDHLDDDDDVDDDEEEEHYGVSHEEEVYTTEAPRSSGIVHVDHSYHCLKIPSPAPSSSSPSRQYSRSSLLHTPSDSEDEIDVVSVGSPGSVHSSRSTTKRHGDTTYITTTTTTASGGMKKIVRVRTSSLPAKPSRRVQKQLQKAMAAGVKRQGPSGGVSSSSPDAAQSVVLLRKSGVPASLLKTPKRLQRNLIPRKRRSPKSDSDDPEKRHLHNSLERMRRVDLRNAFEELRALVPELCDRDKAPKVEILKKASNYCQSVVVKERNLLQEIERQKRHHNELRKRLLSLQRQIH